MPLIRDGVDADLPQLSEAFRQMWLDNHVHESAIEPDYAARVERFITEARVDAAFRFFVAEDDEGFVGAACAQLFRGLYPAILVPDVRRYGYVWGVWVDERVRRQGLGEELTRRCVDALRALGCTHVLLHAAPPGVHIYEGIGFVATNEMRLTLGS